MVWPEECARREVNSDKNCEMDTALLEIPEKD